MSNKKRLSHLAFIYTALILVIVILGGFAFTIPRLLNATFHLQQLIYDVSISYYKFQWAVSSRDSFGDKRASRRAQLEERIHEFETNKFFIEIKNINPELEISINAVNVLLTAYMQTELPIYANILDRELTRISASIEEYVEQQKYTLTLSLAAALFMLTAMLLLLVYLYCRNKSLVEQLEKAVNDREYLIREVHHRVKNNLSIISSLISLKSKAFADESILNDIQHQISAIGIVHESLYRQDTIGQVDCSYYLNRLLQNVFYSLSSIPVKIEVDTGDLALNPKRIVPLGLIITEMATNALKHAFIGREEGFFSVKINSDGDPDIIHIEVSNSGHRFPEAVDPFKDSSMGFELIQTLVRQLDGTIELRREPLTVFVIEIPSD